MLTQKSPSLLIKVSPMYPSIPHRGSGGGGGGVSHHCMSDCFWGHSPKRLTWSDEIYGLHENYLCTSRISAGTET